MASLIYKSALYDQARDRIDYVADSFRVMLVGPGYMPDARHRRRSDVTDEIAGRGYEAGGAPVAVTVVEDADGTTRITLGGALWAPASLAAQGAVYYKSRGGDPGEDELVAYIGQDEVVRSSNGNWQLDASTILLRDQ